MITNVLLGSSETTIIAAGASQEIAVLSILFRNSDTTDRTLTVYAYPSAGSASATTMIIGALVIPAGDTYLWTCNEKFVLTNGDKITGLSDVASKIATCANYMEP